MLIDKSACRLLCLRCVMLTSPQVASLAPDRQSATPSTSVDVRISFSAFHSASGWLQAAALALRDYPLVNSSLAPDESAIVQHNVVNMGIAVNTPYGLAVPNIKNVQGGGWGRSHLEANPLLKSSGPLARLWMRQW